MDTEHTPEFYAAKARELRQMASLAARTRLRVELLTAAGEMQKIADAAYYPPKDVRNSGKISRPH